MSFVTSESTEPFVFKCSLSFRLRNSPATFLSLMDILLAGVLWMCCLDYLDAIECFKEIEVADHIELLREV